MARKAKIPMLAHEWRASVSLSGVYALRMLGMFLVLPVLALHAHQLAGDGASSLKMVGLAMAAYGLTQAVLQLPLGMLSDKIGRKKVIYLGMTVFAAGSFWAACTSSVESLIMARAVQGAGAVSAAVTALLADLTREEVRTRAMSMIGLTLGVVAHFDQLVWCGRLVCHHGRVECGKHGVGCLVHTRAAAFTHTSRHTSQSQSLGRSVKKQPVIAP